MFEHPENEKDLTEAEPTPASEINESYKDELDEFTTIFSDPTEHKQKAPKKGNKNRIIAVVSAFLAVAVLVSGTIAVIKLIPEKEEDGASSSSPFEEISVVDVKADSLAQVNVTNSKGTFKLISEQTVKDTDSSSSDTTSSEEETVETTWYVDGVDKSLINSSSVSSIVSSVASIKATRKIDTKTAEDCGFMAPVYTVAVTSREENKDYTVLVGSDSPDGTGTYLKLADKDDIYLVESSVVSGFNFELLDLADTTAFPAAEFSVDTTDYKGDDGTLTSFDKITVSGESFPQEVTILPINSDSELSTYLPYEITSPTQRYADSEKVAPLLSLFSSGLTVSGAYSFDVSSASLAAVGLDKPDIIVTLEIKGEKKTYKMARVDDTSFAVINNLSVMIKKVDASNIAFADYSAENFYSTWVLMQSINDLSNFTLSYEGTDYSFDIVYDGSEDAEETYVITHGGKKITAEYFQNFYQQFVGLNCSDFTVQDIADSPQVSIVLTMSADGSTKRLDFVKCSETKYQYSIDGKPLGRVTSSAVNKLIKNIKLVAQNKDVK